MHDAPHYVLPDAIRMASAACPRELSCEQEGPRCSIKVTIGSSAGVVRCASDLECPFRRGGTSLAGEELGVCTCPARLHLYRAHRL